MKRKIIGLSVCVCLGLFLANSAAFGALKPGDAAPDFTIEAAQGGKTFVFDLKTALSRGPVVLYFYPKSFTSVCTVEAHAFAEAMPAFKDAGASVVGISGDKIETQREFSSKECRDQFPVGADPSLKVIKSYDAGFAIPGTSVGFANRISFVVAPDGKILSSYADPDGEPHIKKALEVVKAWRAGQGR